MAAALEARGLIKEFRGFRAVDGVDLRVEEGEIHAILGPNGAGKTTLFNLLSGFLPPTAGSVELFGESITHLAPHRIVRRGLSRSFQISSVFESLTSLENLVVALQAASPWPMRFWRSHRVLRQFHPRAEQILEQVNLTSSGGRSRRDARW
jgi:branched-chain amino acid transport system ATP-binding protein